MPSASCMRLPLARSRLSYKNPHQLTSAYRSSVRAGQRHQPCRETHRPLQSVREAQETALRLLLEPAGIAASRSVHLDPLHRSMIGVAQSGELGHREPEYPTAMQTLLEVHDTPSSSSSGAPLPLGTAGFWIAQVAAPARPAYARPRRRSAAPITARKHNRRTLTMYGQAYLCRPRVRKAEVTCSAR